MAKRPFEVTLRRLLTSYATIEVWANSIEEANTKVRDEIDHDRLNITLDAESSTLQIYHTVPKIVD